MRNLKKVLSLALAMVMLLGMMVVGAGATSFTDDADITHQEAVTVVSGMEILTGVGDNTFNPKGTLSRAEAAVVIAKLDLGAAFGNLATTNASTFKDVGAGYGWAKPYIDYCAARGLIAGDGNGYFMPADKVTGVQFALMVARVLGYEDANESIGGADWEVNAAALARKAGLTIDVELGSNAIPRDDMAQVAFNALTADMVEYKQSAITIGDITIPAGKASPVDGTNKNNNTAGKDYRIGAADDATKQLCEEKFPTLKLNPNSTDNMGHPAQKWSYKGEEVGTYAKTPSYTGYITAKNNTLAKFVDNISKRLDETAPSEVYVNGIATAYSSPAVGDYVELYVSSTDSSKIDKIVVTHKTVAELSGDATTRVVDGETQVRVPGVTGLTAFNSNITTSNVHGYEGLVAGDIVLWYRGGNADHDAPGNSWYIEKANSFEGTLTAASSSNVYTIDGNKYDQSGVSRTLNNITVTDFNKQSATWFTDNDNNIVWVKGVENTDVAYVIALKNDSDNWDDGVASGSSSDTAMLLLPDNTVVTTKYKNSGKQIASPAADFTADAGTFVKYTVKDDVYTLSDAGTAAAGKAGNNVATNGATLTVNRGNPTVAFAATHGNDVLTNADTLFFIRDFDKNFAYKNSFAMYTGYANVPDIAATVIQNDDADDDNTADQIPHAAVAYVGANGYAKYVVIYAGQVANTSSASEIFYVVDGRVTTQYDADGVSGYSVRAIKNGDDEITNLVFKSNPAVSAGNAYVINTYDGEQINTFTHVADKNPTDCVVAAAAGYEKVTATTVKLGGTAYGMKDDAKVYYVDPAKDEGDELTVMSVSELDKDVNDDIIAIRGAKTNADNSYYSIVTLFITANPDGRGQLPQGAGGTAIGNMLTQEGAATVTDPAIDAPISVGNGQTLTITGTPTGTDTITVNGTGKVVLDDVTAMPKLAGNGTVEITGTTVMTGMAWSGATIAALNLSKPSTTTDAPSDGDVTAMTGGRAASTVKFTGDGKTDFWGSSHTIAEVLTRQSAGSITLQWFALSATQLPQNATVSCKVYTTTDKSDGGVAMYLASWGSPEYTETGSTGQDFVIPIGDNDKLIEFTVATSSGANTYKYDWTL